VAGPIDEQRAASGDGVLAPHRKALTIGMVSTVTLVAFESLAVITILPDIEDDLVGLSWYGWVTSAFFLGTLIGIVVAGDQADRRGLGRPYVTGLSLFALGLVLGGLAMSMPVLVAARFVQGLGAGVVPAIGYIAIGRVYPEALRPRMFAVLSTAWVVPGIAGPALAERVSNGPGWRWVFLGLIPLVLIAGTIVIPAMLAVRSDDETLDAPPRGRLVDAVLVAGGAAMVVGAFTSSVLLVPLLLAGGIAVGFRPLLRLTPSGTFRAASGLPAVILSRGLLTFGFFGADTFVPHALTDARGASTASGSIAVSASVLGWTSGSWLQERKVATLGERTLIRAGYVLLAAGGAGVAVTAATVTLPVWLIHVSWTVGGLGIGIAYSVHSQLVLSRSRTAELGASTSALQLCDNLGVALGAGVTGAVVTFADGRSWDPGNGVALALLIPVSVAVGGVALSTRLPSRRQAPVSRGTVPSHGN